MREIKRKNNLLKIVLLTVVLIASIATTAIISSIAADFEVSETADLENNVSGVVASYSTGFTISEGSFKGYFNDRALTALETHPAIFCLWHGKALFDQGTRSTLNRVYNSDIDMDWLVIFLQSEPILSQIFATATGNVNQANIGSNSTLNLILPLPPLAEQKRIVKRVEELLALCDGLK